MISSDQGQNNDAADIEGIEQLYDYLVEANDFKKKGDNFYNNKKFEKALKTYEIAKDLINDYWATVNHNEKKSEDVVQLRLHILLAMLESAYRLDLVEYCITIAQECIEASPISIARFHYVLAKSVLRFNDLLRSEINVNGQELEI